MAEKKPWYKNWNIVRHPCPAESFHAIEILLPHSEKHKKVTVLIAGSETMVLVDMLEAALSELNKK